MMFCWPLAGLSGCCISLGGTRRRGNWQYALMREWSVSWVRIIPTPEMRRPIFGQSSNDGMAKEKSETPMFGNSGPSFYVAGSVEVLLSSMLVLTQARSTALVPHSQRKHTFHVNFVKKHRIPLHSLSKTLHQLTYHDHHDALPTSPYPTKRSPQT